MVASSLTLFFTIILADQTILALKRTSATQWYPNTIEFTGGEGLAAADFEDDGLTINTMERWFLRGVSQEFLPTSGMNNTKRLQLARSSLGLVGKLAAIGYAEMDCSFPLFVVGTPH